MGQATGDHPSATAVEKTGKTKGVKLTLVNGVCPVKVQAGWQLRQTFKFWNFHLRWWQD